MIFHGCLWLQTVEVYNCTQGLVSIWYVADHVSAGSCQCSFCSARHPTARTTFISDMLFHGCSQQKWPHLFDLDSTFAINVLASGGSSSPVFETFLNIFGQPSSNAFGPNMYHDLNMRPKRFNFENIKRPQWFECLTLRTAQGGHQVHAEGMPSPCLACCEQHLVSHGKKEVKRCLLAWCPAESQIPSRKVLQVIVHRHDSQTACMIILNTCC